MKLNISFISLNGTCSWGKSSLSQMFYKIGVFKNFAIFTEKHHRKTPVLESLFNKVEGLRPATY